MRTFDSCLTSTWLKVCSFQQSLCTSNIIHEIKKKKEGIENHFGLLAHRGSRTVLLLAYIFTVHGLLETDGVKTSVADCKRQKRKVHNVKKKILSNIHESQRSSKSLVEKTWNNCWQTLVGISQAKRKTCTLNSSSQIGRRGEKK